MIRQSSWFLRRAATPAALAYSAVIAACASAPPAGGTPAGTQAPAPGGTAAAVTTGTPWGVKTREHVDLWLHGFALIQDDTARVPLFLRGYRDDLIVARNRESVTTALDSNRTRLRTRFEQNRTLINVQFAALYFGTWDEMRTAIDIFLRAEGDPRRASDQQTQQLIAFFAQQLPAPADREWLRLFTASLVDEGRKFHHAWWMARTRERAAVLSRVDSLWQRTYRPKLQPFLNNSGQAAGDLLLSVAIGGEGRTVAAGKQQNVVAVTFPSTVAQAEEAIYVLAHEVTGNIAATAVRDNVTPAELREGAGDRYQSAAAVRTGALLLQRVAPELVAGYARFYLRQIGQNATSDPVAALTAAFSLPQAVRDAIGRQLDIVLGGI
jgi:hypothetical protein